MEEETEDEMVTSLELLENLTPELRSSIVEDYRAILNNPREDDKAIKIKEQCIYRLARLYTQAQNFDEVVALLKSNTEFWSIIPKAKTAKIVRNILTMVSSVPDSLDLQVSLCKDVVAWCVAEKRTFLRQRIEAKLASLLLQQKKPTDALELIDVLLKELKKLDDKQMLTEVHLTEARIYHVLQNIPKAKASLTSSRTVANAIYVVPLLQAEIDEMSGILHCEETDYSTAFSYFLEAFEAYDQVKTNKMISTVDTAGASAITCLKYMILCKVLNETADEVPSLLSSKLGMKHSGVEIEAMAAIASAAKARSLEGFKTAVGKYEQYLTTDDLIRHHLDLLYDKMMQNNLLKIIAPYSKVELDHVAKLINLPTLTVTHKLSQMILDRTFNGILDQGKGQLIVYEAGEEDTNFEKGVEIIGNMGLVVEALFGRAKGVGNTAAATPAAIKSS
jgi:26S proteasome regulatory subunit N6